MSHGTTLFKKTSIALGIVTLVSAKFASAASWSSGDWSVSFDSNFSLPKKELDKNIIANLSQIGCTQEEIGSVVGISARTLQRRYADLVEENKNIGKASLRKRMWKAALNGNPNMMVWLSKNYLGMKDRTVTENVTEPL